MASSSTAESRPTTRTTARRPPPARVGFERRIKFYCLLLCLPSFLLCAGLLWQQHVSPTAMIGVMVFAALALLLAGSLLVEQILRPLQTLANVVAALREEDYSFRARGAVRNDALGELAIEINALADTLQSQRLSALEATALLRRVIEAMDAPVLAFDQGGFLRLLNPAGERVLALKSARDLGRPAAQLDLTRLLDLADEGIISLPAQGHAARWMVRRTTFRQRGVPHTLLVLSDVSAALREEERSAWRRLIRVLGHEISNSLAPIKSIAGSLRFRLTGVPEDAGISDDFERGLNVIESRSESLNRFVQAYRQLAQLPAPSLRRVSLEPLLQRLISLETRLPIKLVSSADVDLIADPDQLEQLLINLFRNAVEAALSLADQASPETEAAAPEVRVSVARLPDAAVLVIEDNGPGLTNPANLFVPFYTTKSSGSGVGLVLARQIAEAHGGTVELRNRADTQGCRAEVRIPMGTRNPELPGSLH
jgi:two-component system nitrogen regulation sensor histidine kinase NtrY